MTIDDPSLKTKPKGVNPGASTRTPRIRVVREPGALALLRQDDLVPRKRAKVQPSQSSLDFQRGSSSQSPQGSGAGARPTITLMQYDAIEAKASIVRVSYDFATNETTHERLATVAFDSYLNLTGVCGPCTKVRSTTPTGAGANTNTNTNELTYKDLERWHLSTFCKEYYQLKGDEHK